MLRELTIQTKGLTTEKFPIDDSFAWAQRQFCTAVEDQYNNGKPVRVIVLKARQLGISTATEAILFNWGFIHHGTNGLVIAHESEASGGLFEKTKMYWDTWPFRPYYTLKYATRRELSWVETRSHIKVATAKNVASGRGSTLHAVHASECAFYNDPETLMVGLNQTIPDKHGTIVVLESTANGVGNWFPLRVGAPAEIVHLTLRPRGAHGHAARIRSGLGERRPATPAARVWAADPPCG